MRTWYLKPTTTVESGQRGGIGGLDGEDDYALEIGCNSNADPKLMAIAILHDEIIEFLSMSSGPISSMLLERYLWVKQGVEEMR